MDKQTFEEITADTLEKMRDLLADLVADQLKLEQRVTKLELHLAGIMEEWKN